MQLYSLPRCVITLGLLALAGAAQAQSFAAPVLYSSGRNSSPYDVKIADVNADGKPDLLTANYVGTVGVLLGTGTGTFLTAITYNVSNGVSSVAVADVNGDGKPDLLAATIMGVGVLLGNGDGTFKTSTNYRTSTNGGPTTSVAVADVNGDGKLDLLATNFGDRSAGVLLGNGNGTFQTAVTYSTGGNNNPNAIAVADVNGDNKLDLLTASTGVSVGAVGVLLGNGNGTFQTVASYVVGIVGRGTTLTGVAVADVNGDSKPDLLASNSSDSVVGVLLGNGAGSFSYGTPSVFATGLAPAAVAVVDVNGDGKLDAITADNAGSSASVLLGNGNGTFQPAVAYRNSSYQLLGLAVGDVNGDGKPDIITANYGNSTVGVLLNTTVLATRAIVSGGTVGLSPNPARNSSTFTATGLPVGAHRVEPTLYNALGQVVRQLTAAAITGMVQTEVPLAGLPTGVYLLRLNVYDAMGGALGTLPTQRLSVE